MIQLREQYYAMQVDDANNAVVIGGAITWRTPSATGRGFIQLPPGTWQIVCMSKEATEEQARAIVEEFSLRGSIRYTDYTRKYMWHGTAIESLKSLLTSKGRDTKQNYLILKKTA